MASKRIALVIGNNYPNSDKELKFAAADAIKMKEILEDKNICYFDNIVILINKTSKDAATELEKLFKNAHHGDLIFIYFSGHGKKDFTNNLYLLFEDTNEEFLLSTSLSFDFINKCRKYPQAIKASVIIVLDCCYSAAAGMKDTDITGTIANYCSTGTIILTSTGSTGAPTAMEDNELKHSVFTYYLIEGLEKGYADYNNDGYVSIDELYNYAFEKTKERCLQSPMKEGSIEGNVFISKNPLKIINKEYEFKKKRLLDEFGDRLPADVLGECQAILRKYYKTSFILEKDDKIVLGCIESLLKDDLLPEKVDDAIQNCIEAVQQLKGINIKQQEEQERKQREEEIREKEEQARLRKQKEEVGIKTKERIRIGSNYFGEKKLFRLGVGVIFGIVLLLVMTNSINLGFPYPVNSNNTNQSQNLYTYKNTSNTSYTANATASNLVDQSYVFQNLGKYNESLEVCDKAIDLDPNYTAAWNNKGIALNSLDRYDEALQAYDKVIDIDPNYTGAWNNKAITLTELGRYDEAIKACNKAIELEPNVPNAWRQKGSALNYLGRYDEAIQACNKAIELDSNNSYAWCTKGQALDNSGRYIEALQACNKAIELDPKNVFAWRAKGCALFYLGRCDEAIQACDKAIELDPSNSAIWNIKGEALDVLGKHDEASACYNKSLELNN